MNSSVDGTKSLGKISTRTAEILKKKKTFVPRSPRRGQHLTGLPRYRHAHQNGSRFVFNGCEAGESDFAAMDSQHATYLTQDHQYKRMMMVQENGAIARERHVLQDEGVDRLFTIINERDHALDTRDAHEIRCALQQRAALAPGYLALDGARVQRKMNQEADTVERARLALRQRQQRGTNDPSWREVEARKAELADARAARHKLAQRTVVAKAKPPGALSDNEERSYMRFLKEGPRPGDGAFVGSIAEDGAQAARAALDRTRSLDTTRKLWKRAT